MVVREYAREVYNVVQVYSPRTLKVAISVLLARVRACAFAVEWRHPTVSPNLKTRRTYSRCTYQVSSATRRQQSYRLACLQYSSSARASVTRLRARLIDTTNVANLGARGVKRPTLPPRYTIFCTL